MSLDDRTYESALVVFLYEAKQAGCDLDAIFERAKDGIIASPVRPGPNFQSDAIKALKDKIEEVKKVG